MTIDLVTRDCWLNPPAYPVNVRAFHTAVIASIGADKCAGIQIHTDPLPYGRISAQMMPDVVPGAEDLAAQAALDAHDPVFLSANKAWLWADDTDEVTISVSAPRPGAAPVSLLVAGISVPVTLIDGAGTITISSADPAIIHISVENPANRSTDTISLEARRP